MKERNPPIFENSLFQDLAVEISQHNFPQIRDAEFFIRSDGIIVNTEGWFHPPGLLIGEVIYVPDENGDRDIFGTKYKKVTLKTETYDAIPYPERGRILRQYDSALDQSSINPFFAKYKQIFPRSEFVAYFPSSQTMIKVLEKLAGPDDNLYRDLENLEMLFGISLQDMHVGFTGSALLGNFRNSHDLDLVFNGTLEQNIEMAKKIATLVKKDPRRRVLEGGKGWNIRFYNDNGTLICCFFGYRKPEEAPLVDFSMEILEQQVQINGVVVNDTHSIYTPSVIDLAHVTASNGLKNIPSSLKLIIYHTASRGECFAGDTVKATGAFVEVKTPESTQKAICVIEREGVRNLTPTWQDFYSNFSAL